MRGAPKGSRSKTITGQEKPIVTALFYLLLITSAEFITNFFSAAGGITLYLFILIGLILNLPALPDGSLKRLLAALCLIPLIRIIGASVPPIGPGEIYRFPFVYGPLIIAAFFILFSFRMKLAEVSLAIKRSQMRWQLIIASSGLVFGLLEYAILKPYPLIRELNAYTLIMPSLIMIIFVGFAEELIFRGLLQTIASRIAGDSAGIIYVSFLFAILHVGYIQGFLHLSILDVPAVFAIALFFSWMVKRTGSILGVTLSHGLTNIGLFLILPFLFR